MIDPIQILKTSAVLVPTSSASSVLPIPTVTDGPSHVFQDVGSAGAKTLWVVCILMGISTVSFSFLAFRTPVQKRLFHVITTFITAFAFLSYFAMATGDGISYTTSIIKESHEHVPDTYTHIHRQILWARYVDWSVTTPLLLIDLGFLAGMNGANLTVAIVSDLVMILTGLFAAFGSSSGQKWGWYTWACVAYVVIIYQLAVAGRRNALARDSSVAKFYSSIAGFTLILWTAYPVIWALGDGTRTLSVDAEIVAYAVLDVLAKAVFGFWLLITHAKVPATNVPLSGAWSTGFGDREGTLRVGEDED